MAKYCEHCGNKLIENAKYCDACGAAVVVAPVEAVPADVVPTEVVPEKAAPTEAAPEHPEDFIRLLRWSARLDLMVAVCSIITSLLFAFITVVLVIFGVITFWIIIGMLMIVGAVMSGGVTFVLWTLAGTHLSSRRKINKILRSEGSFNLQDRKVMKKALIIELVSIIVGWLCSYGFLRPEVTKFLDGTNTDIASAAFALFLLFFFVCVIANQVVKFIAYKRAGELIADKEAG